MSRRSPIPLLALTLLLCACSLNREPHPSASFGARTGDAAVGRGDAGPPEDAGHDAGIPDRDAGHATGGSGGGAAGATGGHEDSGAEPCAAGCPDAKPVCLSPSGTCVECASETHCAKSKAPICDRERHACVGCTEDAQCETNTPRCDTSAAECVQCLDGADCTDPEAPRCDPDSHGCAACVEHADCDGNADAPLCDPNTGRCVACLSPADCSDLAAPECASGACAPCADDDACSGRPGTTVCDTSPTSATRGRCVQCMVSDESACNGTVCDPVAQRCTDRPRASKTTCRECIADSECVADHRCVPLMYQGQPRTNAYCMKQASSGCARPFAAAPLTRASRSGAAVESYCGIDEDNTSCEAITALVDDLACTSNDAGCAGPGGMCRSVNGVANRCTYACGAASQCPAGFTCAAGYCGSM